MNSFMLHRSKTSENSLTLSLVKVEDEGTYVCVVENSVGRAEKEIKLRVHGKCEDVLMFVGFCFKVLCCF